ncbi:nuclear transport factor 2 family protein [Mycobacterium sp. SMC-4]|uniref:nuclear transport factor 2 family protein n=1 Tax=Mycobacterium sp. SMC-4 TaxID=2857059 RepID=UPI0021B1B8CB|nr:nuclear transport factor 2 family protein [Mycobacterium sp. SMC-4]UXA19430.1 nuclear transport factor 2 family protein [Mycobacterium sp. SMC-4]
MSVIDTDRVAVIADALFAAIERGDRAQVAALFGPDVAVRKTGDDRDNGHGRSVRIIGWFIDATLDRRYEVLDRQFFPGGFVQQHVLHFTALSGEEIAMRVCIVIKIGDDGLITRIDEYFDPADMAPLLSPRPDPA